MPGGPSEKGGKKERPSEHKKRTSAENARKAREHQQQLRADDPEKVAIREMKRVLRTALTEQGTKFLVEVIEAGPFSEVVKRDDKGRPQIIELYEDKSRLWQYAMNFAADRAGMPRVQQVDIEADAIPPLRVELPDFPKPSDT